MSSSSSSSTRTEAVVAETTSSKKEDKKMKMKSSPLSSAEPHLMTSNTSISKGIKAHAKVEEGEVLGGGKKVTLFKDEDEEDDDNTNYSGASGTKKTSSSLSKEVVDVINKTKQNKLEAEDEGEDHLPISTAFAAKLEATNKLAARQKKSAAFESVELSSGVVRAFLRATKLACIEHKKKAVSTTTTSTATTTAMNSSSASSTGASKQQHGVQTITEHDIFSLVLSRHRMKCDSEAAKLVQPGGTSSSLVPKNTSATTSEVEALSQIPAIRLAERDLMKWALATAYKIKKNKQQQQQQVPLIASSTTAAQLPSSSSSSSSSLSSAIPTSLPNTISSHPIPVAANSSVAVSERIRKRTRQESKEQQQQQLPDSDSKKIKRLTTTIDQHNDDHRDDDDEDGNAKKSHQRTKGAAAAAVSIPTSKTVVSVAASEGVFSNLGATTATHNATAASNITSQQQTLKTSSNNNIQKNINKKRKKHGRGAGARRGLDFRGEPKFEEMHPSWQAKRRVTRHELKVISKALRKGPEAVEEEVKL